MIRLRFSIDLWYQIAAWPADFIFNIHAAQTDHQRVVTEDLQINPASLSVNISNIPGGGRLMQVKAGPGELSVRYGATVDIEHYVESPAALAEVPAAELPPSVIEYVYPSRYCQSDRLRNLVTREFGHLAPGYGRAQAIRDWVNSRTAFMPGASDDGTSALDTLIKQAGVCRDFAHLMIALCRAANIPARFVTGIDYGADPILGPLDFHAYVEAFLGDRWYLFDPTGISPRMGLVRLATGRDAADVAFATMFGTIASRAPVITMEAEEDAENGFVLPQRTEAALSSMALSE